MTYRCGILVSKEPFNFKRYYVAEGLLGIRRAGGNVEQACDEIINYYGNARHTFFVLSQQQSCREVLVKDAQFATRVVNSIRPRKGYTYKFIVEWGSRNPSDDRQFVINSIIRRLMRRGHPEIQVDYKSDKIVTTTEFLDVQPVVNSFLGLFIYWVVGSEKLRNGNLNLLRTLFRHTINYRQSKILAALFTHLTYKELVEYGNLRNDSGVDSFMKSIIRVPQITEKLKNFIINYKLEGPGYNEFSANYMQKLGIERANVDRW